MCVFVRIYIYIVIYIYSHTHYIYDYGVRVRSHSLISQISTFPVGTQHITEHPNFLLELISYHD